MLAAKCQLPPASFPLFRAPCLPKLYIAVALSGAMSHIAGCLGSKVIVAINKDKEANIFSVAHFGIVGDYKEVLPTLIAKLKELKSK